MLGIPNLNTVYKDDTGEVILHDIGGEGKMLIVHAEVIPTVNRQVLNHYADVINLLGVNLGELGHKEMEAWVLTEEQIRFAEFFGFRLTGEEITIDGQKNYTPIYQMKKEL